MTSLEPGQTLETPAIAANQRWNHTGMLLQSARTYRFEVPEGDRWTDLIIPFDADGDSRWYMRWAESRRRVKTANWFALIGTLGEDDRSAFVIGRRLEGFRPATDGELVCYANDWWSMYWNNHGSIRLRVTCVA